MTERILGPTRGRRRKRLALLVPVIALAALILAIGASAGPVSNAALFQGDDGNLVDNAAGPGIDWNSFDPVSWSGGTSPYRDTSKVDLGWEFKGIEDAQNDGTDTVFAGGTKQDDNCAKVISGPKPPNKDDLKRIYIASKSTATNTYLALAWVRIPQNTTSASAHVAFEFNQSSTACGAGSDGLVQRSTANGGDMLVVYDFEGGSNSPTLKLLRWQSTGICEQTGKSAATTGPCWVFALDLTAGGFAEARVNVGSTADDDLAPPASPATASVTETLGDSEFGEAIIDLTGAGVFAATPTTCLSFGKVFGVSRSSGNSGQAQMKDIDGPGNISISNCATVIIRKQTVPDEDPNATDFTYSNNVQTLPGPANVGNFPLKDDGVKTINDVKPATGLNVTESDPSPLYALTSITCTAGSTATNIVTTPLSNRKVTFDIAAGQTLDCTFTNTKQKVQSSMNTAPWFYPNDKATVTAGTGQSNISGSVEFKLFGATNGADPKTALQNCQANGATGLLYSESVDLAAATGTAKTVNTSNPGTTGSPNSLKVESSATVYWRVAYGGDTNHFGRLSDCVENINATLTNHTGGTNVP